MKNRPVTLYFVLIRGLASRATYVQWKDYQRRGWNLVDQTPLHRAADGCQTRVVTRYVGRYQGPADPGAIRRAALFATTLEGDVPPELDVRPVGAVTLGQAKATHWRAVDELAAVGFELPPDCLLDDGDGDEESEALGDQSPEAGAANPGESGP